VQHVTHSEWPFVLLYSVRLCFPCGKADPAADASGGWIRPPSSPTPPKPGETRAHLLGMHAHVHKLTSERGDRGASEGKDWAQSAVIDCQQKTLEGVQGSTWWLTSPTGAESLTDHQQVVRTFIRRAPIKYQPPPIMSHEASSRFQQARSGGMLLAGASYVCYSYHTFSASTT